MSATQEYYSKTAATFTRLAASGRYEFGHVVQTANRARPDRLVVVGDASSYAGAERARAALSKAEGR